MHAATKMVLGGLIAAGAMCAGGCMTLGMLVGGMAASAHDAGSTTFKPEYDGLQGKTFAVIIAADRAIQADFPDAVARLTITISDRLAQFAGGSGFVPGQKVLEWQYNNPRWSTLPLGELAAELKVERLVYIDLIDYRLNDPGNAYLWAGLATGNVGVIEADSAIPDDFAFQSQVSVKFPDEDGVGPAELPFAAVNTELCRRFTDRASWLFYTHDEPNRIEY